MSDHSGLFHRTESAEHDMERGGGMRVSIDDLLKKHEKAIAELRAAVSDVLPTTPCYKDGPGYDDVFLLRFVLTWEKKGGLKESAPALRECIKLVPEGPRTQMMTAPCLSRFRTENMAVLDRTCETGLEPNHEIARKFMTTGYAGSLGGMEPIFIVRTGYANLKALMNTIKEEDLIENMSISKEIGFRICDKLTRKTRQLIKMISVVDMANFSMFGGEPRFYKCLGESSKHSAVNYPQLLGKSVLINTPSFLRIIFGAFGIFMPKSALEKITICPAGSTWEKVGEKGAGSCPFIKRWGGTDADVPAFLGGTADCPPELVARDGVLAGLTKVTVGARSKEVVPFMVPAEQCEAKWELIVEDFGIGMQAVLHPEDGSEPIEVMAYQKIKAESGLATGTILLPKKGELRITFDNSYSLLRSKTFDYSMDVKTSGTEGIEAGMKAVSVADKPRALEGLQM